MPLEAPVFSEAGVTSASGRGQLGVHANLGRNGLGGRIALHVKDDQFTGKIEVLCGGGVSVPGCDGTFGKVDLAP